MRDLGFIRRIFWSCIGWCKLGCVTSVDEGTARGDRLLVVTRCAPCSTAAPVCCHSSQLAGTEDIRNPLRYFLMNTSSLCYLYSDWLSVAAAILVSLTVAPLTSPPPVCLPSPGIQSGRPRCDASAQHSALNTEAYRHKSTNHNSKSLALLKKSPRGVQRGRGFAAPLRFPKFPN